MRWVKVAMAGMVLLVLAGCGSLNPFPDHIYSSPPANKSSSSAGSDKAKTKPYSVLGHTYYPLKSAAGYDEIGYASWYGRDFHGKRTANGEVYNMYALSAAHKTLPLGTRVRVTNLSNSRSCILTINDRGPFVNGRILDLSYGAAKRLGTVGDGVVKVRITALVSAPSQPKQVLASVKRYHVRVGAFSVRENALQLRRRLERAGYENANITVVSRDGRVLHIVQAGSFASREQAERVMERLKPEFPTCYIIS